MLCFKKIGISGTLDDHLVEKTVFKIIHLLNILGLKFAVDDRLQIPDHSLPLQDIIKEVDILLIVGGDGTFLRVARQTFFTTLPIIGIHCGRLGFLTEIDADLLYNSFISIFIDHKYKQEERLVLECTDSAHGNPLLALNDFVVTLHDHQKLLEFSLSVKSTLVYQQRGDGIIVATPTGSTAYALSAGGPILTPDLDVQLVVPMFPHTLNLRPLVFPSDQTLSLLCESENKGMIKINADGQEIRSLESPHLMTIKKFKNKIRILHLDSYSFYSTLRTKFDWSSQHILRRK